MEQTLWEAAKHDLDAIYRAVESLEATFPGRKFTPDGHLVGSIGEVAAAYMFGLELNPASTPGYDAVSRCGRKVEIKLTQGKSVALRHEPEHLIAMQRPKGGRIAVVFNGPGAIAWESSGKMQKNGQRVIGISKLKSLQENLKTSHGLPIIRHMSL